MKICFAALLCFSLLLSAVACTPKSQTSQKEYRALYNDIVSRYTELLIAKRDGKELPEPSTDGMSEQESAIARALHGIVSTHENPDTLQNYGYGYKDMDGNGIPELILLTRYTTIKAIFTISGEQPILLEANYGDGTGFLFAANNRLLMARDTVTDHIEEVTYYTCHVEGDKMVYDAVYGQVYDQEKKELLEIFQTVDGKRTPIDENAFNALYYEQGRTSQANYPLGRLITPRIHLPLAESVDTGDLPVADFSSYAAIRDTYQKISTCLDTFEIGAWIFGEYDHLFSYPNDLSYEYYNRLLYSAYHGTFCKGYDEIDLNSDGQDELVLMSEDYRISAIFTQKDGTPVLLPGTNAAVTYWLDDRGGVHVDRSHIDELEYSLYEFTKDGEFNLTYSILVTNRGNRYLTRDGKTQPFSYEDSMDLYYNDYCRYSDPFEPNEQTRNVSGLTYTPLVQSGDDPMQTAVAEIWHKNANLDDIADISFAYSNTYVTFENASIVPTYADFRYTLTLCYPDPDREHHSLEETTESTLRVTIREENGDVVFEGGGVKGRFEFGRTRLWIIIEESDDQRFAIGHHCYSIYDPQE